MRKAILVVYDTCVASWSIMFERSCFLSNIKALYINKFICTSPDNFDCGRKCTMATPLLVYVYFYKNIFKRKSDQCTFASSFAWFYSTVTHFRHLWCTISCVSYSTQVALKFCSYHLVLNEVPNNNDFTRVASIVLNEAPNSNDTTCVVNNMRLTIMGA